MRKKAAEPKVLDVAEGRRLLAAVEAERSSSDEPSPWHDNRDWMRWCEWIDANASALLDAAAERDLVCDQIGRLADWWTRTAAGGRSGYDIACGDHAQSLRVVLMEKGSTS